MSQIMDSKRKRETNFSAKEERELVSLVKKHSNVIENKQTDSEANKKKHLVWLHLTKEFNSNCGDNFRSTESLKNKYLNLKKNAKKKFAEEKKYQYGTGGGPSMHIVDGPIESGIKEIIGSQMTGFDAICDGDVPDFVIEEIADNRVDSDEVIIGMGDNVGNCSGSVNFTNENSSYSNDWAKASVENLRTPISKKLQVNESSGTRTRDNCLKTKLSDWAKAKEDSATTLKLCLLEEHRQKLSHNIEKHELEIEQSREKHELEIKFRKEEHEIKMSILKLEKKKLLQN